MWRSEKASERLRNGRKREDGIDRNGEHEVHWSHAIRVLACLLALINRFIYREAMSAGPSLALSSISAYIHVHIISLLAVGRDRTMCESKWVGLCTEISADVGANLDVE